VLTESIRNYFDILARTEDPYAPSFSVLLADDEDDRVAGRRPRVKEPGKQSTAQAR
jgi:hypothetical protein